MGRCIIKGEDKKPFIGRQMYSQSITKTSSSFIRIGFLKYKKVL
jgi:hypothetical protein